MTFEEWFGQSRHFDRLTPASDGLIAAREAWFAAQAALSEKAALYTPLERILKWLSAHEDMRDDQWVAAGRYLTNGDVAEKITYGDMRAAFRSASGDMEMTWNAAIEQAAQVAEGWDYPLLASDIRKERLPSPTAAEEQDK